MTPPARRKEPPEDFNEALRDIYSNVAILMDRTEKLGEFFDKVIIIETTQNNCRARQMSRLPGELQSRQTAFQMVVMIVAVVSLFLTIFRDRIFPPRETVCTKEEVRQMISEEIKHNLAEIR